MRRFSILLVFAMTLFVARAAKADHCNYALSNPSPATCGATSICVDETNATCGTTSVQTIVVTSCTYTASNPTPGCIGAIANESTLNGTTMTVSPPVPALPGAWLIAMIALVLGTGVWISRSRLPARTV